MRIFVFDQNDQDCVSAVRKLSSRALQPNMFFPVTEAEFAALRDSMMSIEVDVPPKSPTPEGEAQENGSQTKQTPFSGE